jgi:hypothetical protein
VETSAQGITAPAAVYEIAGRRFEVGARGFAEAIADAHASHRRPRCMCLVHGVEMYVARLGGPNGGYIVKRMPDTGSHHAPDCPSYEPPADLSGLAQVMGSAITEDPATGETTLKLDFPLTKMPGRSQMPPAGAICDSVASDGTRLSLRGLLHYLWDQAELTRWHPGFAGKRTWATVRRHLLQAAEHKLALGGALGARLYVPEPFSVEERAAINARRLAQWQRAAAPPGKPQQLMLLIGEVKEILPAGFGFKAIVKHSPDQAFLLDEQLYRRLGRRFEPELALWGSAEDIHMLMIGTFAVKGGTPHIVELSLMPVTGQWLPIEDAYDRELVGRLVREARTFIKSLRFNLTAPDCIPSAILLDTGDTPMPLRVVRSSGEASPANVGRWGSESSGGGWWWNPEHEQPPPLPVRVGARPAKEGQRASTGSGTSRPEGTETAA